MKQDDLKEILEVLEHAQRELPTDEFWYDINSAIEKVRFEIFTLQIQKLD